MTDMKFVLPGCCEESTRSRAVFLDYLSEQVGDAGYEGDPVWCVRGWHQNYDVVVNCKVEHCPFCLSKLPAVRKKEGDVKVTSFSDGGYYCDTCEKRLIACDCLPPNLAYEVIR